MPHPNKKSLQRSILTTSIYDALYSGQCHKIVLLGLSCVFATFGHAQEIKVSSPDTTAVDTAIQKIEEKQQQYVDEQLSQQWQEYLQMQQKELDASLHQFDEEAVYQLNDADIPQVDQSMANEIYQLAEQAQQEARQQESTIPPVTQLIQSQNAISAEITSDVSSQHTTGQVDQLITQLQNEEIKTPILQEQTIDPSNPKTAPEAVPKKRGFFSRIFKRNQPLEEQTVENLPKINVTVQGVNGPLAANIQAKLSNFTVEAFEDFNVALPQLKTMTTQAAQAVGYYQSQFQFSKQDEDTLLVSVKANDPVLVKSQNIEFFGEGANRPAFQVIKVVPDLNEDDVFNHGLYETTKGRITSAASDQGYFDGYWRMHDAKVTLPENTADINLKYETGERYQLHGVEFRMSDPEKPFPLRRSVLEQLVPFKDGDDYISWRINLLSNNLINSRYFNYAQVNVIKPDPPEVPLELPPDVQALLQQKEQDQYQLINTDLYQASETTEEPVSQQVMDENEFAGAEEPAQAQAAMAKIPEQSEDTDETEQLKKQAQLDKKIPVIVTLNADNPNNLETGIGYGTDTGVRLRTQYRRAIVNDRGHSFDANLELSQKRQSIDGRYMIPYKHPLNDYFSLVGGYEREVRDGIGQGVELDIESAVLGAERSIKRPLGQWQQIGRAHV